MRDPPRLSPATLGQIAAGVETPAYDRDAVEIGVVHLGPGAFHRAHQAKVFDDLLARDPRWGICAISLQSPGVRDALDPQGGLYTLVELDLQARFRVIGAVKQILVAPEKPEAALAALASPQVRLITLTATEKGYRLGSAGDLDFTHPDIAHDAARPAVPLSAVGWLVEGLRRRRAADAPPVSVISCDNLTGNGRKLAAAVSALARAQGDAELAGGLDGAACFPNTMVDSITPATDDALKALVRDRLGLDDAWPIQREAFSQWVIEERLAPGAPDLASVGVTMTADVAPFEQAKLRLLNAAHSALAYLGLLAGLETVGEAMANPRLADLVEAMMRQDIAHLLTPAPGLDLAGYIDALLARFRNPGLRHRLFQIAADGSQKLPIRLIPSLQAALAAGRPIDRLCAPLAAWILFVIRQTRAGTPLADPLAARLEAVARRCDGDAAQTAALFMQMEAVFPAALAADAAFAGALTDALKLRLGSS